MSSSRSDGIATTCPSMVLCVAAIGGGGGSSTSTAGGARGRCCDVCLSCSRLVARAGRLFSAALSSRSLSVVTAAMRIPKRRVRTGSLRASPRGIGSIGARDADTTSANVIRW
eukprot:scaffold28398_cov28-Tisochrysis_lutea.AAC.4